MLTCSKPVKQLSSLAISACRDPTPLLMQPQQRCCELQCLMNQLCCCASLLAMWLYSRLGAETDAHSHSGVACVAPGAVTVAAARRRQQTVSQQLFLTRVRVSKLTPES